MGSYCCLAVFVAHQEVADNLKVKPLSTQELIPTQPSPKNTKNKNFTETKFNPNERQGALFLHIITMVPTVAKPI